MRIVPVVAAILTCLFITLPLHAATIDLGTAQNSADWLVSGGGAVDSPSFPTNVNRTGAIAITSNALRTGTFAAGGNLAAFDGFWVAKNEFLLPANATGTVLSFSDFYANDRGLLRLNGVEVGNVDHLGATGTGVFKKSQIGNDESFEFTGLDAGSINSGFLLGQTNVLEIVINNTGDIPITAPTMTFDGTGDATTAFINASVSFTAIPEPSCGFGLSCLAVIALTKRRCRQRERG